MSDLIERQAAIELLLKWADGYSYIETPTESAVEEFRKLPSAEQDVLDTNVEDTISRKAAIEAFQKELCREREYAIGFSGIERILNALPSAQPETEERMPKTEQNVSEVDVICRKDAIDAICKYCEYYYNENVIQAIKDLPSAQPRMKGRWVQISPAKIYECSECGQNVMTDDIGAYRWCHGCGADMRGEKDNE